MIVRNKVWHDPEMWQVCSVEDRWPYLQFSLYLCTICFLSTDLWKGVGKRQPLNRTTCTSRLSSQYSGRVLRSRCLPLLHYNLRFDIPCREGWEWHRQNNDHIKGPTEDWFVEREWMTVNVVQASGHVGRRCMSLELRCLRTNKQSDM